MAFEKFLYVRPCPSLPYSNCKCSSPSTLLGLNKRQARTTKPKYLVIGVSRRFWASRHAFLFFTGNLMSSLLCIPCFLWSFLWSKSRRCKGDGGCLLTNWLLPWEGVRVGYGTILLVSLEKWLGPRHSSHGKVGSFPLFPEDSGN